MKPWCWLLLVGCVGVTLYVCREGSTQTSFAPPRPQPIAAQPHYLGAGSCAASACHNANFPHGESLTEYGFWVTRDPHAKAYEVLFNQRSESIQRNLQSNVVAHHDQRCLGCHAGPHYVESSPPPKARHFKTDGVSCESCHGPASEWIGEHHLDAWRTLSADEKKLRGMNDTRSLTGRAQVCATCHVGAKGMDVDHDLIAAGHPRLNFEFAAFHAYLPRHWPDAKDRAGVADFEARVWAAGQLATTHAALALLAERAGSAGKPWPEFAEFDCTACHHDLKSPSARQKPGGKLGALRWGPTTFAIETLPLIFPEHKSTHDALRAVHNRMDTPGASRAAIARDAAATVRLLQAAFADPSVKALDAKKLTQALLKARHATDEETTQWLLGITALTAADPNFSQKSLGKFRLSPYDPEAVQKRLINLKMP